MSEMTNEVVENVFVDEFSLEALLNPTLSRVAKTLDNLSLLIYGDNGTGKTPVACQFPKPYYLAFGKNGLSGLNNVPFKGIHSWSDFKIFVDTILAPENYERVHSMFQTFIFDEVETAFRYCETYVSASEGVNKIKEGNGGYGLWKDLETEWKDVMLKILGSGFTVIFIFKTQSDESGKQTPRADKRCLPVIKDNCDIIGYVMPNGLDENGKPIHSSLILAECDLCTARTRNEYFDPMIEDFTAQNLIDAYYTAIDRQAEAENVAPVTKEERDKMFEKKTVKTFDELVTEIKELGSEVVKKHGAEKRTEITDKVLGAGKKVSQCTEKQREQLEVIIAEFKKLLA